LTHPIAAEDRDFLDALHGRVEPVSVPYEQAC